MFLINKHTGEAIEWERNITYKVGKTYKSLAEFNADWEDAEVVSTRELLDLRRRNAELSLAQARTVHIDKDAKF